jgi:hypothetical protein
MSNSLGSLSGVLILQRALRLTFLKFPALNILSLGFRELDGAVDNALLNQQVVTRTRQVASVTSFGSAASAVTTTDVPVTLTNIQQVLQNFTTSDYNSTNRDLIEEQAEPIAVGIAQHIVASAAAFWTPTNYPVISKLIVASGWGYVNTDLALKAKLEVAGVPDMGDRFFAYNSPVETARLADPLIVSALNNPANQFAIRDGKLPQVAGLRQAPFYGIPSNSVNLVGVAGTPDATAYAARAPKNPEELLPGARFPGVLGYVTDPVTGFRVMVNQWIDTQLGLNNRIVWIEGYAVGNPNNLALLTTA